MPAVIDSIDININNISNENFSVEKLLETQKVYRKRRIEEVMRNKAIEEEEDNEEVMAEDTQRLESTKKPKLKFGMDSILEGGQHFAVNKPLNCESNQLVEGLMPSSRGTQVEYFGPYYESQCFLQLNKPLISHYNDWNFYPNISTIGSNNFGDGFYSYPNQYSHYSHPSEMRNGVQSANHSKKKNSGRAVFNSHQRRGLEKNFQKQKYITKPERQKLAHSLGLSDSQVKVWFQNRRMKWRHSPEYKEEVAKTQYHSKQSVLVSSFSKNAENDNNSKEI